MPLARLETNVGLLKGVGPALAQRLERLNVTTARDLLLHFPYRYEDYSQVAHIRDLRPGPIVVAGVIEQVAARWAQTKRLHIIEAIISDGTGTLKAIWFNQRYLQTKLVAGQSVVLAGRLEFRNSDLALQSPQIEFTNDSAKGRIVPIYPETAGLTSKQISALVEQIIATSTLLPDLLPDDLRIAAGLMTLSEAVTALHLPQISHDIERARRRMAFEELFFLIACGLMIKQEVAKEPARRLVFDEAVARNFTAQIGFDLTDAQRKAAWQILRDIDQAHAMNRLLEGDVGSGKTVVAALAATMAQAAGYQTALMVPTEVLANQHAAKLAPLAAKLGYRVAQMSGKLPLAKRREVLEQISSGDVSLIVGTQALLSKDVNFHQLGLVVIDEQHRFGVEQRQLLKAKAGYLPHLLTMTATPIPRTLALAIYGDLDISVIDELPPGRKPVKTSVVRESGRSKIYDLVDAEIEQGRQVYVVCPLIEESDALDFKSVETEEKRLREGPFSHRRMAGLHGRMKSDEKERIMAQFAAGEIDILVATSLIEVGVDVANASVMMIEAADRFGLATLHQLRGRVGRGSAQAYCYLFSSSNIGAGDRRLAALEHTNDGFRLAQIDMQERGAGQVYGLRQHGRLDLQFADIGNTKLLAEARLAAQAFVGDGARMLQYPGSVERINQLKTVTSLD